MDKKLFNQSSIIGLKQGGKGFPVNNEIGVLKWRLQTKDEELIPLTSKFKINIVIRCVVRYHLYNLKNVKNI